VGRALQQEYGQEPQVIMMMPILEGLDGVQKMSKSLGNYVGVNEPPQEMFGKLMSVSDDLMWRYYLLLTDLAPAEIAELKNSVAAATAHPLEMKKKLARRIISDFHGAPAADGAQKDWEAQFQRKGIPDEVRTETLTSFAPVKLTAFLAMHALVSSKAEAARKIKEGAVSIAVGDAEAPSWERISDPAWEFDPAKYSDHGPIIFRVGRRLLKVKSTP